MSACQCQYADLRIFYVLKHTQHSPLSKVPATANCDTYFNRYTSRILLTSLNSSVDVFVSIVIYRNIKCIHPKYGKDFLVREPLICFSIVVGIFSVWSLKGFPCQCRNYSLKFKIVLQYICY